MARLYRRSRKLTDTSEPEKLCFLLNDELIELDKVHPTQTILQFLRQQKGLCGTKDACSEGYCGACTVAIGELQGNTVKYRAVNSCISFVASLHSKHLITVEGIKQKGKLHPAQQLLVTNHASQCGFCTPGIVMSLYTLCYQPPAKVSREKIDDVLAGNLCRCTGYRPIIAAAQKLLKRKNLSRFGVNPRQSATKLKKTPYKKSAVFKHRDGMYHSPITADELADLVQKHKNATLVAGGTEVGLWVTMQRQKLGRVISLERVHALKMIRKGKDMFTLGAGATLNQAREAITADYPPLGELIRRFGSEQIRNRATVVGNIANGSPVGDLLPALIVLDSKITLRVGNYRRFLKLEDFYIDYGKQNIKQGEFIETLQIPRNKIPAVFRVYKLSKRFDQDISSVCAAFFLRLDAEQMVTDIRICYAGMARIVKRAGNLERALMEEKWSLQNINQVLPLFEKDYQPITDCRGSEQYRMTAARNLLIRFYLETQSDSIQTRLVGESGG